MPFSTDDLLEHVRWLRIAAHAAGAELIIAGDHLGAFFRRGAEHRFLLPRFVTPTDAGAVHTPALFAQTHGFAGWLPYPGKRWPIATDRLRFKELARAAGLPAADAFTTPEKAPEDVVVKHAVSSATARVRGPFRAANEQPVDPEQGEYYEPYLEGDRLRLWFWNGKPICAQLDAPPAVIGDGVSPLRDLILHRASYTGPRSEDQGLALLEAAKVFLRFHGRTLDTVLTRGERQAVDLRHGSPLRHPSDRHTIDLRATTDLPWMPVVGKTGAVLFDAIPEPIRASTLFSLDAILDAREQLWLLDMDCDPVVHPLTYPEIVKSLFELGPPEEPTTVPSPEPATTTARSES